MTHETAKYMSSVVFKYGLGYNRNEKMLTKYGLYRKMTIND